MAKENAKRNRASNLKRLQLFTTITLVLTALHILHRYFVVAGDDGIGLRDFFVVSFWFSQEWMAIRLLRAHGTPTLTSSGDIDTCPDLANPLELGVFSYAQDLLWTAWGVQFLSFLSSWFLALYTAVPAFALHKAWTMFIGPLLSQRSAAVAQAQQPVHEEPVEAEEGALSKLRRRRGEARAGKK